MSSEIIHIVIIYLKKHMHTEHHNKKDTCHNNYELFENNK